MSISYDAKGNTTGTTLTGTNTSDKITSSAAYDSTGNYVTSQTDARGNTVTYAYGNNISKMTGQPTAVTDPTNVTRTSTYNSQNGRVTGTEITGTASLDYIYGSGRLTTMTRSGYVPGDTTEQTQSYTMSYDGFGNMTGVSVGNRSLATYTYGSKNGQLSQMSYGNGDSVSYSYDNLERVQNVYYNGSSSPALTYSYKGEGTLGSLTDSVNNRTYSYTYDSLGRLSAMTEKSGSTSVQTYNASYDTANRLTGYNYQLSPAWDGTLGSTRTYGYTYKASDGSLSSMTAPGGSYAYNYDGLKRLSSRVLTVGGTTLINRQLGYLAGAGTNGTTLLVSSLTNKDAGGGTISQYNYTYDALGNITAISGSTSATYTYDNQGQLLTETVGGTTWTYTYDTYGNLRSKTDGTNTDTYTYGDSQWLDLLTAYNGNTISYDAIGNPTTWYDGTTFTWVNGRRLASATNTDEGLTASYTYDSDGLRLTKTVNGVEHKYLWQGSKLVSEYYDGKELEFFYDESGNPYAFSYKSSSTATPVTYYYLTNLQGDITGILDSSGNSVATYTYNAWGKLLSSTGDLASINPLRYRGYYYDAELGMYYLKSRYYDPEICRFISADNAGSTGQGFLGCNMFAYCLNNPVNFSDPDGFMPKCLEEFVDNAKNIVKDFKDALTKEKQKQYNGTLVVGLNYSLGFGAGTGGSIGLGIDNNGNIGLVTGSSIGGAMPTVSLTGFVSVSNASDLKALEGKSFVFGASYGEGAVFGGEVTVMPDYAKGSTSMAGTAQIGIGVGIPFELHSEYARGSVLSINIYDVLIAGCNYILGG